MKNVCDVKGIREAEKRAICSVEDEIAVVKKVATEAFEALTDEIKNKRIAVVCGKGNNGADGFALAEMLDNATVFCPVGVSSKAEEYYRDRCVKKGVDIREGFDISEFDVVIDCLFGIGFHGYPMGVYADIIDEINAKRKEGVFVVCFDVPSGLSADDGYAEKAVVADMTLTVQQTKTGLLINKGREYSGEIVELNCGLDVKPRAKVIEALDFKTYFRKRSITGAKNEYGYVGILGGSDNYVGAPSLAASALASLRSGAGVSRVIVPKTIAPLVSGFVPEITVFPVDAFSDKEIDESVKGLSALAVGMGWGRGRSAALKHILTSFKGRLVIDADGLYSLVELKDYLKTLPLPAILTPHEREFLRLFGVKPTLENVEKAARNYNCIILSKGATTIITDGKETLLSLSGSSGMATAGSGDVLSGVITAFLAYAEPLYATAFAAYVCGLAGEEAAKKYGEMGMISSDTIKELAFVTKRLSS